MIPVISDKMWLRSIVVGCLVMLGVYTHAQSIEMTNERIRYINESIHGTLIVHRIFESFNQEINSYVDVPRYEIEYTNADLPADVFDDPEGWFYEESPRSIYAGLDRSSGGAAGRSAVSAFHNVSGMLNNKRIEIATFIKNNDLNKVATIGKLYKELEAISAAYLRLKGSVKNYESELLPDMTAITLRDDRKQVYTAVLEIHYDLKEILRLMSDGQQSGVIRRLSKIEKERTWLNTCIKEIRSEQEKTDLGKVASLISSTVDLIQEYVHRASVPSEYKAYGKGYYYHNAKLLTNINRYGNGYVSEMNHLMDEYQWAAIHFLEEPHHYKTIYPQLTPKRVLSRPDIETVTLEQLRAEEQAAQVAAQKPKPTPKKPSRSSFFNGSKPKEDKKEEEKVILTAQPKRPPMEIVDTRTLIVDSFKFTIQLYDHLIKDGDRLSINVNGKWEYEDISIETDPKVLGITVNPGGDNYIIIQALNEGFRPPNTVGIRYRGANSSETMRIDLKPTQAVRINYRMR